MQITIKVNQQNYTLSPGRYNTFEDFYVDVQLEEILGGQRISLYLHPKTDIVLNEAALRLPLPAQAGMQFFANGYQSWSESQLLSVFAEIPRLRRIARSRLQYSGDEWIGGIRRGKGNLHAWNYTYLQGIEPGNPDTVLFAGSLNERSAFTIFQYDAAAGQLQVRKDIENLQLSHSYPLLDCWIVRGKTDALSSYFDAWTQLAETARSTQGKTLGWTSWYRHFNQISAEKIQHDLDAVAQSELPFDWFQVDDGWQTAVGDWFSTKPEFPGGMAAIAAKIRQHQLKPGLWIAPFVAAAHSEQVRKHPEWLLKDKNGKVLRAGWNPLWGGWFYAFDFYHPGFRDYMSGVFHVVLEKWGYELLKLDFLYAAALAPPPNKTRGQVMSEAMEWLRALCGRATLLACGAPLGACLGEVELYRTGADTHLRWEHQLLAFLRHRERVSTLSALRNTLSRWQLDARVFRNDPDVFLLRNEGQHLNVIQQNTLLTLNALLGGALVTSDDVSAYTPEQRCELLEALDWQQAKVEQVQALRQDIFAIKGIHRGQSFTFLCNLSAKAQVIDQIPLEPFETLPI